MASFTIKNVPDDLLSRLRGRASEERRSLNQQILYLLESALIGTPDVGALKAHAERQAAAWGRLAGRWQSQQTVENEIASIYDQRTEGRAVDL